MNGEHCQVKGDWNDNEAERSGEEMLEPEPCGNMFWIAQHDPELDKGQAANPSNSEETNPLDANCSTQRKTSRCKPEPPSWAERFGWTKLLLIAEAYESQCRDCRGCDKRRIEED